MGRVGDADIAHPFLLGVHRDVVAPVGGRLAIGINQTDDDTGDGTYKVHIEIYAADPHAAYRVAGKVRDISGVDANLFSKIPRHIADKEGNPEDMVNFFIIGSGYAMQKALPNTGW